MAKKTAKSVKPQAQENTKTQNISEKEEEDILKNLIPLKDDELKKAGIPYSAKTLYRWHSQGIYPSIFIRIGRRVFLNKRQFAKKLLEFEQEAIRREKALKDKIKADFFATVLGL